MGTQIDLLLQTFYGHRKSIKRPKMKLFLLAVVGCLAVSVNAIDMAKEKRSHPSDIISDEEISRIIISVVKQQAQGDPTAEGYGIISIITELPSLIAAFKPVLSQYWDVITDSSLSISEKVSAIWEVTKSDAMLDIIKAVGTTAAKEILKKLVIAAVTALG